MTDTLNVLIVDDTVTYRSILSNIVSNIPDATVAATASNGKIALAKLEHLKVDLVLLDIEMPEMDGLETLGILNKNHPDIGVVMVSGLNKSSADITIRALELGALEFIPKPDGINVEDSKNELQQKLTQVFRHFRSKRLARLTTTKSTVTPTPILNPSTNQNPVIASPPSKPSSLPTVPGHFDVLVIGVSTGGPNALSEVLPMLPEDLNIPVLLVQHMPPIFTESLASSLNRKSRLNVKEAAHHDLVLPNTAYIAPGGKHMEIFKAGHDVKILIHEGPPENSCRPAVDVLFRSISPVYGKNVLSLIMTGMGSDGALGVKSLKQTGCYSLVQSEKSCVVYGMPKAVEELRLADESVDLSLLAQRITQLVRKGRGL
ncbi:protein-glutamate methylesterase/protein-glutamine glutaminase [Vampirovibrio chlorellavorus]|uniref:protein-glutamate methylesterase/protein-glutamine glutaminase n=1 Tax=Vampirovibrio chlorellavorus TaxID=758823 RepID=UPI0026EF3AC0|nr:chemotaxis response regulator protein-glutamate methylesterase [Vampirovibrio chlorellavorus]